ncbi:MAG TPA: hypothetical protein VGQ83_12950 [Polyangia bacterium]|jgi:hypothetical protein
MRARLVCPDSPALFERLHGQALVVRVRDAAAIAGAAGRARASDNELVCVLCDSPEPLDELSPDDGWDGAPVALFVPALGRLRDLLPWLPRLREPHARVYVPAGGPDNLTGVRILASLGVACGLTFGDRPPPWEPLADLMSYALLGPVPHAPIEPFAHLAEAYDPAGVTDWRRTVFADPRHYLHLDADGRVALTSADLQARIFVLDDPGALDGIERHPAFVAAEHAWRRLFLAYHPCSRCPGWRVCRGAFAASAERDPGCAAFCAELMDVVDQRRAARAAPEEPQPWRP